MDLAKIKEAGARIRTGAWVKDIPVAGFRGVALRVRGTSNADLRKLREMLVAAAVTEAAGPLPPEKLTAINDRLITETILQDWNITEAGARVPCTPEKVAEFLADPDLGILLREAVSWASDQVAEKGLAELEAAAGN